VTETKRTTTAVIEAEVREGTYGDKVAAVEPGGAEFIPLGDRHGTPLQQFWTWVSPNMEFATIFVGIIGVWFFGQSFWMATLAIVLGTALGSLSMGTLAARGPLFGVPQMVLSGSGSASSVTSCPPASTRSWPASAGSRSTASVARSR
jgi:NCS1 family nucleobase:cation symporter-1